METTIAVKRRRRASAEERARILAEYHASGKTQREFSAEVGISLATLMVWLRQSRKNVDAGKLIEVAMPAATSGCLEIIFPQSAMIRVPVGAPSEWVMQIVGALRCGG